MRLRIGGGVLILGSVAVVPAAEPPQQPPAPLAPTTVTWSKPQAVLGEILKEFPSTPGVELAVAPGVLKTPFQPAFHQTPFWQALQTAADQTKTRLLLSNRGQKIELIPRGDSQVVAATQGAFRIVAHQVVGRAILDEGVTSHELTLLVHWEPRLRVYRIDTTPRVRHIDDATGSKLSVAGGGTQIVPTGATSEMKLRISGLSRASPGIRTLAADFRVTAAQQLLVFTFAAPAGQRPPPQTQANVTATLQRVEKRDHWWEIEVAVLYPDKQPVFESFQGEWWLRDNRLVVTSPAGKAFVIRDFEVAAPDNPYPLRVIHRFREDGAQGLGNPTAQGWTITYETPSPLVEWTVPFELHNIPLP
ncbi:MAG: hypothetical protein RMJ56_14155 [Gemmataceae bacterium]|nr:hypothetical protein [Gemmata sp.]MDW8198736.1 hypothetical protein [Gemmataceae bacterium]